MCLCTAKFTNCLARSLHYLSTDIARPFDLFIVAIGLGEGHANVRILWSRNGNLGLRSLPLASAFILRDPMLIGRKFIDLFCPSRRRSRSRW